MPQRSSNSENRSIHQLQCMEIWNGNRSTENNIASAGIQAWVFSQPYHGESQGGDIHYLSLCLGGIVTRIVVADVAGHGSRVAETSKQLRNLLRRFMNAKKQDRLVVELNRQFIELKSDDGFATAVVASYLSNKSKLLLTNAGHPRPLLYQQSTGTWSCLNEEKNSNVQSNNLPLGLDAETSYQHFVIKIEPDDWLLLYTDAYIDACDVQDQPLGEKGLIGLVRQISTSLSVNQFGKELNRRVREYSHSFAHDDDTTLIAIRFNNKRRRPALVEKLRGYFKAIAALLQR